MEKFECQCRCDDGDCYRFHNPPKPPCNCIRQLSKSTKFIKRILDVSTIISEVLSICGIHECKARAAEEVIIFAFLHYKIVKDPVCDVLRKKLRKNDMFYDLGRKCRLTRPEAHLAYAIIKKAFNAFYYKQRAECYDPDFVSKEQWMQAATKTAEMFAYSQGLREDAKKKLESKIKEAYGKFVLNIEEAVERDKKSNCTCCFCKDSKLYEDKRFKIYANVLPKEDENAYRFKQRLIEEGKKAKACCAYDPCGMKALEWQDKMKEEQRLIEEERLRELELLAQDFKCSCIEGECTCGNCGTVDCVCAEIDVDDIEENKEDNTQG